MRKKERRKEGIHIEEADDGVFKKVRLVNKNLWAKRWERCAGGDRRPGLEKQEYEGTSRGK